MRVLLIAAVLAVGPVVAQDDPFLTGDALQAEIAKSCAEGCVTFSREKSDEFEKQLRAIIAKREQAAFQAGVQYQKSACASLI